MAEPEAQQPELSRTMKVILTIMVGTMWVVAITILAIAILPLTLLGRQK